MGFFNHISSIRNRFKRESADTGKAVRKESEALSLEVQEEAIEAQVQSEVRDFSASWGREVALLKDIAAMQSSKYTLVRGFSAIGAAKRNLSNAKKTVFGSVVRGGKRIQMLTRRAVVGATGVSAISPRFAADMKSWVQEQQKQLEFLANEVSLQINENKQRAAQISPILEKNQAINAKLKEYLTMLRRQNSKLALARVNILREIADEKRELEDSQTALQAEIDAIRQSRV